MTLGGLAIAIGILVDGAIVLVENCERHFHLPQSKDQSKIKIIGEACREVGQPIFFAILIIVIVFLPLLTLQGVEGKTFGPLALTIMMSMSSSLVYAMFLFPP